MVIGTQINYYVALVEYLTIEMFFIVPKLCFLTNVLIARTRINYNKYFTLLNYAVLI